MELIYKPRGRAHEYAPLALNIYKGCEHRCLYCFGPSALQSKRENYFNGPNPKKNVLNRLQKDAQSLREKGINKEILISFIGDPYQPAEIDLGLTRQVIEILIQFDLRFTILTKGGIRAERDFDLLENHPKARFGTTLIFTNQKDADYWEPGAASISDRIKAIEIAHDMCIPTWVSIEPVIIPDQALQLIRDLHTIVDHWKIGKINYNKAIEKSVDWIKFRNEVKELLNSIGSDYYLKKSLTEL